MKNLIAISFLIILASCASMEAVWEGGKEIVTGTVDAVVAYEYKNIQNQNPFPDPDLGDSDTEAPTISLAASLTDRKQSSNHRLNQMHDDLKLAHQLLAEMYKDTVADKLNTAQRTLRKQTFF